MMYLKIAIVAIMLAGGAGAFIYVKTLQADLAMSEANNAKLEGQCEWKEKRHRRSCKR